MLRLALVCLALAGCDVGSVLVDNGNGAQPDASGGGGGGGGGSDSGGGGGGTAPLTVTLTSAPTPTAVYAPSNVLAVWVQNQAGQIVKTINRYSAARTQYLIAWNIAAGANDVDSVSGASRTSHAQPVTATWDLKDRQGTVVPDGTYTIRMEVADQNSTQAGQNNQGTFTFVKGTQPQMQNGLSNGGFTNVTIAFTP